MWKRFNSLPLGRKSNRHKKKNNSFALDFLTRFFVNFRVKKVSMEAWVSGSLRQEFCEQFRKFVTLVSCICFCSNSSILLFLRWASLSSNICRWRNLFRVRLIRKEKGEKNNNKKRSIITCVNWHARGVGKILAHTWQGLKRTLPYKITKNATPRQKHLIWSSYGETIVNKTWNMRPMPGYLRIEDENDTIELRLNVLGYN